MAYLFKYVHPTACQIKKGHPWNAQSEPGVTLWGALTHYGKDWWSPQRRKNIGAMRRVRNTWMTQARNHTAAKAMPDAVRLNGEP